MGSLCHVEGKLGVNEKDIEENSQDGKENQNEEMYVMSEAIYVYITWSQSLERHYACVYAFSVVIASCHVGSYTSIR